MTPPALPPASPRCGRAGLSRPPRRISGGTRRRCATSPSAALDRARRARSLVERIEIRVGGLPPSARDQSTPICGIPMAGHSQFKNIMHRKGRQDAARAKLFAKLAREITVAAKNGTPDPGMNPRLRLAIQAARAENMPKDNIERAIRKAAGGDVDAYDAIRYEGY